MMPKLSSSSPKLWRACGPVALGLLFLAVAACEGDTGPQGPPGPPGASPAPPPDPIATVRTRDEGLPGLNIDITSLAGASGANGAFQVGDQIQVTFTVKLDDGTDVPLDQLDFNGILVSGPTTNYNPVIAQKRDLLTASVSNTPGVWVYTLSAIPAAYLPPLNDTPDFGEDDGELQGKPLLDGTYSVGIELYKAYTIEGVSYRDAANATEHFLFGNAAAIERREVVGMDNCNQCHTELRIHGTIRRDVEYCLLCHTAGAEDKNEPTVEGGTPGVTIDFRVMIHKLHNGKSLPSVQGVATLTDGTGNRNYSATPKPYKIVGFMNSVHDYSKVVFPIWPNISYPLPADSGYSMLPSSAQDQEDEILAGASNCTKCHGDPDGSGPIQAPAQGNRAFDNPTRLACGSCHDDINWDTTYTANQQTMPPQPDDAVCSRCHQASGNPLAAMEGHLHPIKNPVLNKGTVFEITNVAESGTHNMDGTIDPGEKITVDLMIKDDSGAPVDPANLDRIEFVIDGPTDNRNVLWEGRFPPAALGGMSAVTTHLPEILWLEHVGKATGTLGDTFTTGRTPHWNVSGATTEVRVRTPLPTALDNLSEPATALQNFIDVVDTAKFAADDYIVIDDGTPMEEYLRVQWVDTEGGRLWFGSIHDKFDQPWLRYDHDVAVEVKVVNIEDKTEGMDYTLDAATGTITEVVEFGDGNTVLVTYTTDWVMPAVYPPAINDSPDLDGTWGKWTGMTVEDGTYGVAMWGEQEVVYTVPSTPPEVTDYSGPSTAATAYFLGGDASTIQPPEIISAPENCYACHNDLQFHGGHRRGLDTCLTCHGAAGSEDGPRYRWPVAAETTGLSVEFRRMLHKIHMGEDLTHAATYEVVGFRGTGHFYDEVVFPSTPGGVMNCVKCHGTDAWQVPLDRNHSDSTVFTSSWLVSCGSCHDSNHAQAHIDIQTASNGAESCLVCHDVDKELSVERMHRNW